MKVHVVVLPRKSILDPQGKAIAEALQSVGHDSRVRVRAGRCFELDLPDAPPEALREQAAAMARQLLANPITEDFTVVLPGESLS